jgi:hypothetical protein
LVTGVEGVSSRPVRRIVLLAEVRVGRVPNPAQPGQRDVASASSTGTVK